MKLGIVADRQVSLGAMWCAYRAAIYSILDESRIEGVVTTTYGYDAFGSRVLQTGTSTTYIYPFKWYSVASSTGTGAKYSTTTSYIFNGETLVSTVDQQLASGVATGSPATHYIHPDQLGSTNIVTNASGTVEQTLDYFPYGATRISSGQNTESRQYIGQFTDPSSLSYLNARYYNPTQGQFLSQDPVFLGDPKNQVLADPQSLNAYSYSEDNPITKSDPTGKFFGIDDAIEIGLVADIAVEYGPTIIGGIAGGANTYLSHQSNPSTPAPGLAQYTTGIAAGAATGYFTEGTILKLIAAGAISAGGSALQDRENGTASNPWNTGFSFVSPGLGYGIFGRLAGPSAIQELEAGVNGVSSFYGANVVDVGVQQIRYQIASGVFGMGIDSVQRGATNSGSTQQSNNHANSTTQSGGSSGGGGYGSPGSTYTNYVPANAFSACGTLCK